MEQISALEIGKLIKTYRNLSGLTQFELAEIINIDERQMSKIERGVHYPSVPTFLKLISVLNIDINKICYDIKKPQKISAKKNKLLHFVRNATEEDVNLTCKILEIIELKNKN